MSSAAQRSKARRSLADMLRETLLTARTSAASTASAERAPVLLDGEPARSCITLAVQASGSEVTTVEGLGAPNDLHPLQQAFATPTASSAATARRAS